MLKQIIKRILNHPLNQNKKIRALLRFIKWQLNCYLNPYPIIYPFTEKAKLIISKGMEGATGNLYCGLHEYYDMSFLLHFLRENDNFIDVGANIGSYTILASGHCRANSISIEPGVTAFNNLKANVALNCITEKVTLLNIAAGAEAKKLDFTTSHDSMNHVVEQEGNNTQKVDCNCIDNILLKREPPLLIKIDVEGYEAEVIKGAEKTLQNIALKAIIIELKLYSEDKSIDKKLKELGFNPFSYSPIERKLVDINSLSRRNIIYIRDYPFVQHRLSSASKIRILDQEF